MKSAKIVLDKVCINNFLSLHKVELPLKPLTILVGPNASGKSNVLKALELLNKMMIAEELPPAEYVHNMLWAGVADTIGFQLQAKSGKKSIVYKLELQEKKIKSQVSSEELVIDEVKVISVEKGKGEVRDENNENPVSYRSAAKLALKSAGDYGDKPITVTLTEFIRGWEFFDFDPDMIRRANIAAIFMGQVVQARKAIETFNRLDDDGSVLRYLLADWYENDRKRFEAVNGALKQCSGFGIEQRDSNGESGLYLLEGYKNPIPLERASDGTLRLLAYHVLLNEPESPSLVAIEEPERNLHPGVFTELGSILKKLSQKTQVLITTHSSQLLDAFNAEDLSDTLGVLLLRNEPGYGTQVINLEEVQKDRESLRDWMAEFGIGSAIFESQLLQDIVEG
ncbi:MAG: AAA family ATPase [Chloroflexi bacterium]|nr:AAA family ATPase [Chloroflexota bacterium]